MIKCELCGENFTNKAVRTNHLKSFHGKDLADYVVLTEYGGIEPMCGCGHCKERPSFSQGSFLQYAIGHNSFKWRESLYIGKYGQPKCKECGVSIGFKRAIPNSYCSPKCAGKNVGFSLATTQVRIREVVQDKYGVAYISQTPSVRLKISQARRGQKLQPLSEARKEHQSDVMREKWLDTEYRYKTVKAIKESWSSNDRREQMSVKFSKLWKDLDYQNAMRERDLKSAVRMRERWKNDNVFRQKVLKALKNRNYENHSDDIKQLISTSSYAHWKDKEYRQKVTDAVTIAVNTPEERASRSVRQRKRWKDPAYRKAVISALRALWEIPEFRERRLKQLSQIPTKLSGLHIKVREELCLESKGFISEQVIGRYIVDELHEERKLILEVNGDYVHANPNIYKGGDIIALPGNSYTAREKWESDAKKLHNLRKAGYTVLVIWESDDWEKAFENAGF